MVESVATLQELEKEDAFLFQLDSLFGTSGEESGELFPVFCFRKVGSIKMVIYFTQLQSMQFLVIFDEGLEEKTQIVISSFRHLVLLDGEKLGQKTGHLQTELSFESLLQKCFDYVTVEGRNQLQVLLTY